MNLLRRGLHLSNSDVKRVMLITLPAMVELLFSQLFHMVDTVMLGQTAQSEIFLAAVALTNNPVNLVVGILSAFNVGATAAVAWAIGAGDRKTAQAVTRNMLVLDLLVGLLTSVLCAGFAPQIVRFMGAQADTQPFAASYLRIIAYGYVPTAICMGVTASLRGVGLTRVPMMYNLLSNLLNVVGNYVLIYGHWGFPAMGIAGAALSTTLSRLLAMVLSLLFLFLSQTPIRVRIRDDFRLRLSLIKQIFRVGLWGGIEQCIMQFGFMLFTRTVATLGTTVMAAHQVGLSINGLSWVPSQAFGVAATTLVGQDLGAGEAKKAQDHAKMVHRLAMLTSLFVGLLFIVGAHRIAGLYTQDAQVVAMSATVLRLMALGMPGVATQIPIAAALRGARDSLFPLIASAIGIWVFRVLVAPLMIHTLGWGLNGAWISIVLDQTARAVVVYLRFIRGKWMQNAQTA